MFTVIKKKKNPKPIVKWKKRKLPNDMQNINSFT